MHTKWQCKSLKSQISQMRQKQMQATWEMETTRSILWAFKSKKKHLEDANDQMVVDIRRSEHLVDTTAANYAELEKREDALIKRIDRLEAHIQENSRFALAEEYGKGPYQVEFTVSSIRDASVKSRSFVVEMAPSSLMPHSVHHFLRMVSKGLWEGMSLMAKKGQIEATPLDSATAKAANERFEEAKLTKLSFSEHSAEYSPGPYSVTFSGRPGGPGFYINGKQDPRAFAPFLDVDGDSSFGAVVSGKDVIDDIIQSNGDSLSRVLGIERVRLLASSELV